MSSKPRDWQLVCKTLKERRALLFKTRQWCDCTFLVGTACNQDIVFGHKVILAMASPVFEVMFYGLMAQSNKPIRIVDVQKDVFKTILQYIYTDKINISTIDIACELYYAAKKYRLPHLVKKCTKYLVTNLCPNNVCRVYELVCLMEESDVEIKCIKLMKSKTQEVLKASSFEEAELDTVITIFTLNQLNIESELNLFEAALRYAKAMEKRNVGNTTPSTKGPSVNETLHKNQKSSTPQIKVDNIGSSTESIPDAVDAVGAPNQKVKPLDTKEKPSIRSVVGKIRFLTLSAEQFATGPARSRLLSDCEALHILLHILDTDTVMPFPPGFSSCRVPRINKVRHGKYHDLEYYYSKYKYISRRTWKLYWLKNS